MITAGVNDDTKLQQSAVVQPDDGEEDLHVQFHSATDDEDDGEEDAYNSEENESEAGSYHDADKGNQLDYISFDLPNPRSDEHIIQIPLWTVSVQGFHRNRVRLNDQRQLDKLPQELAKTVLELRKTLDPLDMDVPLPALSTNWCRVITVAFFAFLVRIYHSVVRYFASEWRTYQENLVALRLRDWPGYVPPSIAEAAPVVENEEEEGPQVPSCLPSMANLERLFAVNTVAKKYGWFATLVRSERVVPGSRVIGFRIQLSQIQARSSEHDGPPIAFFPDVSPEMEQHGRRVSVEDEQNMESDNPDLKFDEVQISDATHREDSNMSVPSINPAIHGGEPESQKSGEGGLSLHALFNLFNVHQHEAHLPPLLLYRIENAPDLPLSSAEVLSYASTVHF